MVYRPCVGDHQSSAYFMLHILCFFNIINGVISATSISLSVITATAYFIYRSLALLNQHRYCRLELTQYVTSGTLNASNVLKSLIAL